ncbi:MAG: VWA domain-containing protein [Acidobacteria bacterium]|nr:VWA domain-containing protein [Acidobacteriota bacterium]
MRSTIAAAALTLALALPAMAQDAPKYEEKLDVNLVLLDVTVTDRKGNQILGLTKDDFVVKIDGEQKPVESMEYFTNRRLLTVPEAKAEFKVERVKDIRYFVLFFHTYPDPSFRTRFQNDLIAARRASLEFVEKRIRPEDKVAVAGYDLRLKLYADFTSDKPVLKKAIEEAATFSNGITSYPEKPADDAILSHLNLRAMINETGRIYDGLELLADATKTIPARKALLLFSPGIGEASDFSAQIPENDAVWFDPMLVAIQRANVTVYPMHLMRNVRFHASEQNLVRLAEDTGGEYYRQATSFEIPLKMIENKNNGYYLLGLYTGTKSMDERLAKVAVTLRNPEFEVSSRKGM